MRTIPLTQGYEAIVDDEDYGLVMKHKWYTNRVGNHIYAYRNGYSRTPLHRFLMKPPIGFVVDHKDGNGLNCQRSNMRIATHTQNRINRVTHSISGYKGIRQRPNGRWYITSFGSFDTAEEAARVYDRLAREIYGEFAKLNFPGE